MVPFDIVDVVVAQDRRHAIVEEITDLWQRHVQRLLLATQSLILRPQRPIGICAVDITVGIDHFRLKPETKRHAKPVDMFDQWRQSVRIFTLINRPIG